VCLRQQPAVISCGWAQTFPILPCYRLIDRPRLLWQEALPVCCQQPLTSVTGHQSVITLCWTLTIGATIACTIRAAGCQSVAGLSFREAAPDITDNYMVHTAFFSSFQSTNPCCGGWRPAAHDVSHAPGAGMPRTSLCCRPNLQHVVNKVIPLRLTFELSQNSHHN
jgi:hypothetical protein